MLRYFLKIKGPAPPDTKWAPLAKPIHVEKAKNPVGRPRASTESTEKAKNPVGRPPNIPVTATRLGIPIDNI